MSNSDISLSLSLVEEVAEAMDSHVLEALIPLGFSASSEQWSAQFDGIFANKYRSRVQDRKDAIRAMAQEFHDTDRTGQLLRGGSDIVDRAGILRGMLAALDVITSPELQPFENTPFPADRLRVHLPALRDAMRVITGQTSRWQQDFRGWQCVFLTLEDSILVGALLESLPATIPDDYVTRGRAYVEELVGGWNGRKALVEEAIRLVRCDEDPRPLMERLEPQRDTLHSTIGLFMDVVKEMDNLPSLRLLDREHVARHFWEAGSTYERLSLHLDSINQDINRLECVLDHFMAVANATIPAPE
ncbi:hypothetical protein GSI_02820 [Ganoderma sinense ZZ0214-1]|uniref:Uncharacterized protein n=1 Tax=Ganoderma sinense ZZ0214-1 TaxID=1077348 RepID=A0A2G8SMT3_9APHY|nr:hypothetical protein GSI_02820 [Ganoderma sinense ZZ0214-1]